VEVTEAKGDRRGIHVYVAQSHDHTSTSAHETTKRSLERDEHLEEGARGPHARTHDADSYTYSISRVIFFIIIIIILIVIN